jgi:phage anti-repressor protein
MDLQEYLKIYSSINNKFIEDFFSLYKNFTTSADFVIDLDKVCKWLNANKSNIKRTLLNTYTENIDYNITSGKSTGGRPAETILLTPECFKRLSMLSKTENAEKVRTYFIQVEAHLDKYKNYIIEGLNKKIQKYETELKPTPRPKSKGVIYVLKTSEDIEGVYKIGRTKNFADRLKVHQSSHPDKLEVKYVYETDNIESVETCIKGLLKDKGYRKRKEFYEIDIDSLKILIKTCDCLSLVVKNNKQTLKSVECNYVLHISKATN